MSVSRNHLILFVVAWVLTLNGSSMLLDWLGELIVAAGVNPQTPILPIVGLSLQILLNVLAAVFGYLTLKDKTLRPMSMVLVAINSLSVVNALATFLYAVLSGKFTF